ncbi:MAG: serine/threonine-protein kinase [Pyrinomonadaceae bacterium]
MLYCPTCGRHYADDVKSCPEDGTLLQADSTVAMQVPADPLLGRTLDEKYRLDERLGVGGMGTVYRATHLLIDRPVAVKVLNSRFVEDEQAQERFRREAKAAGRLQHTNAVAVTDFGRTVDNLVYLVMELLEGRTLRDILAREAPLDTARSVSLMLQISAAVAAAHEEGIIHRDLKPANIFVVQKRSAPPVVKVLDFGIAKLAADSFEDSDAAHLTQTGVMIGTPRYMSPEQCDGARLTPASDVYSLGIILYEMLTGTTPFTGSTPLAVALKHSSVAPRRPSEFTATIPPELEHVVLHALEKKPEERPADAGEFRRELFETASRLGLEQSSDQMPTFDTLRNAGTQTPSGRLVIDIERLRANRAAHVRTGDTTVLTDTNERPVVTGEKIGAATGEVAPAQKTVETPAEIPARPVFPRMKFQLSRRETWLTWLKQPSVLLGGGAAIILLAVVVISFVNAGSLLNPANEAATPVLSPAVTPTPAAPSPTPTPEESKEHRNAPRQPRRQENARRNAKPSKGPSLIDKLKKIIKKPF